MVTIYARLGEVIYLGQVGENKATNVAFDITENKKKYPYGQVQIVVNKSDGNYLVNGNCYYTGLKKYTSSQTNFPRGYYYFKDAENPGRIHCFELQENIIGDFSYDATSVEDYLIVYFNKGKSNEKKIVTNYITHRLPAGQNQLNIVIGEKSATYNEIPVITESVDEEKTRSFVIWQVMNYDLSEAYKGKCYLIYTQDDSILKTETYYTVVAQPLSELSDEIPEPYDSWIEDVSEKIAYIDARMKEAQNLTNSAGEYSDEAEAWAIGSKDGVPLTSGDQYQNNSKYWANQADLNGEAWAIGSKDGVAIPVPATMNEKEKDPHKENNAKYWASLAHTKANNAANSASAASGHASNAFNYSNQSLQYKNLASGYASNAQTYMDNAQTYMNNAQNHMKDALKYKNNARTYMNDAQNYASNAYNHMNNAQTYMNNAQTYMNNAQTYMNNAYNHSYNAYKHATNAQIYMDHAEIHMKDAGTYADEAKSWAEAARDMAPIIKDGNWHTWDPSLGEDGDYLNTGIPASLKVSRVYESEAAMYADSANVNFYELAIINTSTSLIENSRLYMRNTLEASKAPSLANCWTYLSDLSGVQGVSIKSIDFVSTENLTKKYKIEFTGQLENKTTSFEYSVKDGVGYASYKKDTTAADSKDSSFGKKDTYTLTFTDGSTVPIEVLHGTKIESIELTDQDPKTLIDTYTITDTFGTTYTFKVGSGRGIKSISNPTSNKNVDTYTITYNDNTTSKYQIKNGIGISSITNKSVSNTPGGKDTYTINFDHGLLSAKDFQVYNGQNGIDISGIIVPEETARPNTTDIYQIVRSRNGSEIDRTNLKIYNGKDGTNTITIREWTIS